MSSSVILQSLPAAPAKHSSLASDRCACVPVRVYVRARVHVCLWGLVGIEFCLYSHFMGTHLPYGDK